MAVAYKSAGAGGGTETSGAQLALVCPAVVAANDILIAHLNWIDNVSEPTDPSGWTRLYPTSGLGAPMGTGTPVGRSYVYGKLAAGTEDGTTVNFGTAGGTAGRFGRIYSCDGYVSGTITDIIPAASFSDIPKEDDPALPTVTTTIAGALAIALIAQDDNNALAAGGAQTGGTWAEPVAEFTSTSIGAQGCVCQIQTCTPTANPGTVTGGVLTTAADESSTIGFEIRESALPEITGTGSLTAQASTMDGAGTSLSTGTGTLSAQASAIDGAGISSSSGSGALLAGAAAISGVGEVSGLGVISGSGALQAQASTIDGTGFSSSSGIGTLTAQASTVDGAGVSSSSGQGALLAASSSLDGAGISESTGSGALISGAATIEGFDVAPPAETFTHSRPMLKTVGRMRTS